MELPVAAVYQNPDVRNAVSGVLFHFCPEAGYAWFFFKLKAVMLQFFKLINPSIPDETYSQAIDEILDFEVSIASVCSLNLLSNSMAMLPSFPSSFLTLMPVFELLLIDTPT